jgi:competence protein ComEC
VALLPAMPRGAFALMVIGGLWLCLWRTRWRIAGLAPALLGAAWALATPAPDLLVTGDGQHLAIRTPEGMALLRPRAGDYVRDMLNETSGLAPEPLDIDSLPSAACSPDLCLADIFAGGRSFRILATRSVRFVPVGELARACAEADIAVSDRRLPRTCMPRWIKADRFFLSRTGGLSFTLGKHPRVRTVAEQQGRHPWALAAAPAPR